MKAKSVTNRRITAAGHVCFGVTSGRRSGISGWSAKCQKRTRHESIRAFRSLLVESVSNQYPSECRDKNHPKAMLTSLTIGLRFRFAIILASLAALCFVMPPAALAFGHGEHTAHCLAHADMVDHGAAGSASVDNHAGHSAPASSPQMTCCGLFCLSALAAEIGEVISGSITGSTLLPTGEAHLLSQSPEQPDRPPISLLFV
jgi:hypothetical protein